MEVHHHPHAEKKNFREYFFEFLMIFLAVTLGFIAESIRESISDHSKEKQYITGIKKDLIADTASLNDFLPTLFSRINQTDALISMLQIPGTTNRGSDLYYYARTSTKARLFETTNNTLTELDHSGNFRLITKSDILNGLIRFQKIIDSYKALSVVDQKENDIAYPLLGKLFDASVFNKMVLTNGFKFSVDTTATLFANVYKPAGNPQLREHNADDINQLIFYLHERKSSFIGEVGILQEQKKYAEQLIQLINKEYHLNNR